MPTHPAAETIAKTITMILCNPHHVPMKDCFLCTTAAISTALTAAESRGREQEREKIANWYEETFCLNPDCTCNVAMTEPCKHCLKDCPICNIAHAIRQMKTAG